jgi:glucokinase
MVKYALCGDIGGSNTRLQIYQIEESSTFEQGKLAPGELVCEGYFANHEYESFDDILSTFLRNSNQKRIDACVLAVAGPVVNNSVEFTNLAIQGWSIDGENIKSSWNMGKVKLVNDFLAQGYGVLTLSDTEFITINDATPSDDGPIACVGAGTGLGECFCTRSGPNGQVTCFPSEGGHAEWSPRQPLEIELLKFLLNKFKSRHRVSVERVVSGHGISNIYEFLRTHRDYQDKIDPAIDHQYDEAPASMKGAVVGKNAKKNLVCSKAAETFTSAYGSEVGVVGLKYLPTGGLYICGGIAAKNIDWIQSDTFRDAMLDKGRVSFALKNVPVRLVTVESTGLRGAHVLAFQMLHSVPGSVLASSSSSSYVDDTGTFGCVATLAIGVGMAMFMRRRRHYSSIRSSIALHRRWFS